MPKIKKLKRKKRFRANVNRKRLRNKLTKLPDIGCKQIKDEWEAKRSTVKNLQQMGLAYDPNKVLKIPNVRKEMITFMKDGVEEVESESENAEENVPKKLHVAQSLEEEAKWPRAKLFRLPNNEVMFATYMMDKYGDDYKAMVRDRKNHYQLTWRQIRAKIERFKNVPEQYAEYLVQKGDIVLDDPTPLQKLKPELLKEPVQKKTEAKRSRRKRKQSSLVESIWQEESIVEEKSIDDSIAKPVSDSIESTNESTNNEKKLQLFPDDDDDDENDDDDDDDDDNESDENDDDSDDDDDVDSNASDGSDSGQINCNKLSPLKLSKRKILSQNSKKLKFR